MTITRLEKGPRMAQAVIHNGVIYLAGQVGRGISVTEQTVDMLAAVDRWLAEAGSSKSNILSATVWMANMGDVAEMNAVWDAWIDPENPPARACVEGRMIAPNYLVEVMVTAAV